MSVQVPILNPAYGMTDLVALQSAITLIISDDPRMAVVPVLQEVQFLMDSNISIDMIWQAPRSSWTLSPQGYTFNSGATGPVGAGLLVEMPDFTTNSPSVRGSPATWDINIVCFEERNINFNPTVGTMVTSEQYAQLVVDILQLQYLQPYGTLKVKEQTITKAHDRAQFFPNIIANRVSFEATVGRQQSTPTLAPQATVTGGTCTILCPDAQAVVYYTLDGSMPVGINQSPNNPAGVGAQRYTAPFAVTSGQTVLCAARNPAVGKILSAVNAVTAP